LREKRGKEIRGGPGDSFPIGSPFTPGGVARDRDAGFLYSRGGQERGGKSARDLNNNMGRDVESYPRDHEGERARERRQRRKVGGKRRDPVCPANMGRGKGRKKKAWKTSRGTKPCTLRLHEKALITGPKSGLNDIGGM